VTHGHNRAHQEVSSSDKARNRDRFLGLPSNVVLCRTFAGWGYNLVPGFAMTLNQPGGRSGRTVP
jgi:hypothetical protein